jgi:glucose/arabinose dehydrogenase
VRKTALSLAIAALAAAAAVVAPQASAFDLVQMPGTYERPVHLSGPPGDPTRLLIVEQPGVIRLLKNQTEPATTYLDISGKVQSVEDTDGGNEEGLLSMAFASPTRFYVAYTAGTGADSDVVVEAYDVNAGGDTADPGSADEIIRIPHPVGSNHNGGQIQIGPDGNLWISIGDGGGPGGDSDGDAQDPNRLTGKILRITPRPGDTGYTIPAGNPYEDGGGAPEIWANGLRNPWRFSFDRATGDLLLGDVGEGTQEEIDHAAAPNLGCGSNYGWPWFEGDSVLGSGTEPATHHEPLIVHTRDENFRAIAGGYVIRDTALGDDIGKYVYGDTFVDELRLYDFSTGTSALTGEDVTTLSSFGEDGVGRVYAVSLDGTVHRLVHETNGGSTGAPDLVERSPSCDPPPGNGDGTTPPPGGDGTTPPGGTPPTTPPGTTPGPLRGPRILAATRRRQRALRRRTAFVRVGCDIACTVGVNGRLAVRRARFHLPGGRVQVPAGELRTVRVRIPRRAARSGRRALRRGARVRVIFGLRATAANGQQNVTSRTVRVVR